MTLEVKTPSSESGLLYSYDEIIERTVRAANKAYDQDVFLCVSTYRRPRRRPGSKAPRRKIYSWSGRYKLDIKLHPDDDPDPDLDENNENDENKDKEEEEEEEEEEERQRDDDTSGRNNKKKKKRWTGNNIVWEMGPSEELDRLRQWLRREDGSRRKTGAFTVLTKVKLDVSVSNGGRTRQRQREQDAQALDLLLQAVKAQAKAAYPAPGVEASISFGGTRLDYCKPTGFGTWLGDVFEEGGCKAKCFVGTCCITCLWIPLLIGSCFCGRCCMRATGGELFDLELQPRLRPGALTSLAQRCSDGSLNLVVDGDNLNVAENQLGGEPQFDEDEIGIDDAGSETEEEDDVPIIKDKQRGGGGTGAPSAVLMMRQ